MSPSAPGFSILGVCVRYPLLVNIYKNGTRVFYWAPGEKIKYGTVQGTNRMADVGVCTPSWKIIVLMMYLIGHSDCGGEGRWGRPCTATVVRG